MKYKISKHIAITCLVIIFAFVFAYSCTHIAKASITSFNPVVLQPSRTLSYMTLLDGQKWLIKHGGYTVNHCYPIIYKWNGSVWDTYDGWSQEINVTFSETSIYPQIRCQWSTEAVVMAVLSNSQTSPKVRIPNPLFPNVFISFITR